jgi:diguanylate cyclase (GGDEF)-like protein
MNERFTLLVVDDEKHHRTLLTELLQDDYRIILAKNGAQALELARDHAPDLILLDILMPGLSGIDVIRTLKSDDASRTIPVIFITALDSVADEEMGLELGAVDYIAKPFRPPIVRVRVRNHLQAVHQRRLLEQLAMIDSLTEIPNRRRFTEFYEHEWRRCLRSGQSLSLMILDVDHFKRFNDTYGHSAGDVVLKKVAQTLQAELRRPGDFVARYGGEEFVIVLPEIDAEGAQSVARQICQQVEGLQIRHADTTTGPWLTVSIGGATCIPAWPEIDRSFFSTADNQLYRAKHEGRNQVCWAPHNAG